MIRNIHSTTKEVVTVKYNESHILDYLEIELSDQIILINNRFDEGEMVDIVINEFSDLIAEHGMEDMSLLRLNVSYKNARQFCELGYFISCIDNLLYSLGFYPELDEEKTTKIQTQDGFQKQLTQLFQIAGNIHNELGLDEDRPEDECMLCDLKDFLSYMSENATEEEQECITDLCSEVVCEVDSEEYTHDLPLIEVFKDLDDVLSYLNGDQLIDEGEVIPERVLA